jgi:hypothetical protein
MRGAFRTPVYVLKAQKAYRERNAEKIAEKAKAKYEAHKDTILEKARTARQERKLNQSPP